MKIEIVSQDPSMYYWFLALKEIMGEDVQTKWWFKNRWNIALPNPNYKDIKPDIEIAEHPKYFDLTKDVFRVLALHDVPRYIPWEVMEEMNLVTTHDKSIIPEAKQKGIPIMYLPFAVANQLWYEVRNVSRDGKVCFIGNLWNNRRTFFSGSDIALFTTGWIEGKSIYSQYKMTVNYGAHCDPLNLGQWPHMRIFEGAACGCLPFDSPREDTPSWVQTYKTREDLVDKIRYFLQNPKQLQTLAKEAQRDTLENHTYINRMNKLLEVLRSQYNFD